MLITLALTALASVPVKVTPEAQVRPRFEADTGRDGVDGAGTVGYVTMRSRLGATLSRDDLAVRVVLQDVRFFGEELHPRRDFTAGGIDLRIGTLTWSPGDWELEIGRMERGLYNERLLAASNWRQPGRSNDGARIAFAHGGWSAEARGLLIREGDSTDLSTTDQVVPIENDRGLALLTFGYADDTQSIHPLVFVDLDTDLTQRTQRATPGLYATLTRGPFHLEAEAYTQLGLVANVTTTAGMLGLRGTWAATEHTDLGLGYDLLSGDGDPLDDVNHSFDPLQGAGHRFYGHVDMATYRVGGPGDDQGLQDVIAQGAWKATDRLQLRTDLHALLPAAPSADPFLAIEPDVEMRATLASNLTWSNGANLWFPNGDEATEWMIFSMFDARL